MDWPTLVAEIDKLHTRINFYPDVVIGIVRGGVVPARLLASKLGVNEMYCINFEKNGRERTLVTTIEKDFAGKTVLLVEEMLESGTSLIAACNHFKEKGATVFTAALYISPESWLKPDFYLEVRDSVPRFPWE